MLRPALVLLAVFTLVTGVAYPLVVTAIASAVFPSQAHGSIIRRNDVAVGSSLIAQEFTGDGYFWSRPSATTPPYNASASSASNLGPTNPALAVAVSERSAHGASLDLLTSSGSGLDPHISPESARAQIGRVAQARHLDPTVVEHLVAAHLESRTFGVLGEPRVNVLQLNLALAALSP